MPKAARIARLSSTERDVALTTLIGRLSCMTSLNRGTHRHCSVDFLLHHRVQIVLPDMRIPVASQARRGGGVGVRCKQVMFFGKGCE